MAHRFLKGKRRNSALEVKQTVHKDELAGRGIIRKVDVLSGISFEHVGPIQGLPFPFPRSIKAAVSDFVI